jgi:threonylcarbamoyladenosine tRNA methylthiotransferase MtaB
VQVQNGCDHRCTFCIIPYGRGNSRSVPMGAVVEQARTLAEAAMRDRADRRRCHELRRRPAGRADRSASWPSDPQACAGNEAAAPVVDRFSIEADATSRPDRDEPRLMPHLHLSLQPATT